MKIKLRISENTSPVPFMHQHMLTGVIHKWLGENKEHGEVSLYSFSRLAPGKKVKDHLSFEGGACFFVSAWDKDFIKNLMEGIMNDRKLFCGMEVQEIMLLNDPDLEKRDIFLPASPVLIKRREEDKMHYYFYDSPEATALLTETMHYKMKKAGLPYEPDLEISFDQSDPRKGSKMVSYKKGEHIIKNRASWCRLQIKGSAQSKLFAWNCGVGNSTGIGFGAVE